MSYCEITVSVLWAYGERNVSVLWACCENTVSVLWNYRKLTVSLLWAYCELLWNYCQRTVSLPWSYRERAVSLPWACRELNPIVDRTWLAAKHLLHKWHITRFSNYFKVLIQLFDLYSEGEATGEGGRKNENGRLRIYDHELDETAASHSYHAACRRNKSHLRSADIFRSLVIPHCPISVVALLCVPYSFPLYIW